MSIKKANAPQLRVGDLVRIPRYSSLFGSNDVIVDHEMRKVAWRVVAIDEAICGDDDEGWFDQLDLVNAMTGERFPYMIINSSVEMMP